MRSNRALLVLVTAAALASTGCRSVNPAPRGGYADPVPRANQPSLIAADDLERFVVFGEPIATRSPEDPLRVTVPVRAITEHELNVQYRFEFFDANGRPVPPAPTWRYARLPSRVQRFVEANALDQRAVDWRLEVRPAR